MRTYCGVWILRAKKSYTGETFCGVGLYLLFLHGNNGYVNASQYCVTRTFPVKFILTVASYLALAVEKLVLRQQAISRIEQIQHLSQ